MIDRKHRMKAAVGLRILPALALLVTAWFSTATSVAAQGNGGIVIGVACSLAAECGTEFGVQVSVTTEDGAFLGTCTVMGNLLDSSHVPACAVDFPFRPTGMLIVTEDVNTLSGGYAPVKNPIHIDTTQLGMASHDVIFVNAPQVKNANAAQTSDVAIFTDENGQPAYDACYVLVDYSNAGCDENRDGRVMFADVPWGAYTVHQTADLGPGRHVDDFIIHVRGNISSAGFEEFSATISNATGASASPSGAVDIALITRDPRDGHLLTGTCYVLIDYSSEGCDENGDGQVTFAAIPSGAYTVHQTQAPAGYAPINDYTIDVHPFHGLSKDYAIPLGFVVKQAPQQNAPKTRNVSVVFVDSRKYTKVVADICVQFVGASNVGCDEDLVDGQIDFLDLPAGTHEIKFSNIPSGWQIMGQDRVAPTVTIDAGPGAPADQIIYIGVYVP